MTVENQPMAAKPTPTSTPGSFLMSFSNRENLFRLFIYGVLFIGAIIMIAPFAFLISSSLKLETQVFEFPIRWIPDPVRWMNYVDAMTLKPFGVFLKNTMIIALLNQVAILLTASLCGYGFARIEFPGRDFWFGIALATLMIPYFVIMVPQFVMFARMGWMDSFLPLVVPPFFGGGAFNIFLFRQFFRTFPEELADAARIDGCSEFGIYWRIFVPLAVPAFITVAIFTFMGSWNDFIGPLLYINSPDKFTVAIGLATFRSTLSTRWDLLMAASVAMTAPIVVLFFILQRYFIKGVVMTGIKG
jgi:multiple sugar transport system permease protein